LTYASKIGHVSVVADFLRDVIHPTNIGLSNKTTKELLANLQWNRIVTELISCWFESGADVRILFEVLTFVSLRRLADMEAILQENLSKIKNLVENSKQPGTWDAAYRTFFYSNASSCFQDNFEVTIS